MRADEAGDAVRSDAALMTSVATGDRAALAALYDRHARSAYSLAVRLVGATVAEDVVHDAFVALVERPDTFNPGLGSFRSWFLTVVHHRCLNYLRKQGRVTDDTALATQPDPGPEPAEAMLRQLQDTSVRDALQRLSPAHREVLVLSYYGGLSQTALAERLQTPLGTIKARMRRGLLALRDTFLSQDPNAGEEERA